MHYQIFAAISGLLFPFAVYAQGQINPCIFSDIPCVNSTSEAQNYFANIINGSSGSLVRTFTGILLAMLVFYGLKLIINAESDSTTTEVKSAYGHAITGTILVGAATMLAQTFAATNESTAVFAPTEGLETTLRNVIVSFKLIVYVALIFTLSFQGVRLVIHTDESQAEKAKKQFLYAMIGAAVVILGDAIVNAFVQRDVLIISSQARGVTEFLLTVLGALCVIALFVAGIFLVISVDEQLKERAKKTILASVVVLAVVVLSLAILTVFIEIPIPE